MSGATIRGCEERLSISDGRTLECWKFVQLAAAGADGKGGGGILISEKSLTNANALNNMKCTRHSLSRAK